MTVTPDGVGPSTTLLPPHRGGPDGLVVVHEVGEMVLNEVLA